MVVISLKRRIKITMRMLMKLINTVSTQKIVMKDYREILTSKCNLTKGLPACHSSNLTVYPSISPQVKKRMRKRRSKCRLKIMVMKITLTPLKTNSRDNRCLRLTTANPSSTSRNSTRSTKLHNKLSMMSARSSISKKALIRSLSLLKMPLKSK